MLSCKSLGRQPIRTSVCSQIAPEAPVPGLRRGEPGATGAPDESAPCVTLYRRLLLLRLSFPFVPQVDSRIPVSDTHTSCRGTWVWQGSGAAVPRACRGWMARFRPLSWIWRQERKTPSPFLQICTICREGSVYTCWEPCRRPAARGLGRAPLAGHLHEQRLEAGALLSGFTQFPQRGSFWDPPGAKLLNFLKGTEQ